MCEDAVDELSSHLGCALGVVVERGNGWKDGRSCFRSQLHVAEVDAVEWGFADAENKRTPLLQADVCGAMNKVTREAICDRSQRSHGAGKDDHGAGGVTPARDAGANVGFAVLAQLAAGLAEEFLREIISTA